MTGRAWFLVGFSLGFAFAFEPLIVVMAALTALFLWAVPKDVPPR